MKFETTAQVLNTAIPAGATANSINDLTLRSRGAIASKIITLNASNTTASVNVFQLTGSVHVTKLYALITTKTTLANLTAGSFDLYDSTSALQLTKNDGVLSGLAVGTFIAKLAANGTTWGLNNNVAGALIENPDIALSPIPSLVYKEFIITQKTGANTYIRFTYSTTDAPINATMTIYAEFIPVGASNLAAV